MTAVCFPQLSYRRLGTITQGASGASFYNVTTFGYNAADQIASKSGTNSGYNYTPSAKAISYGINGLNQIANVNGTSFGYDTRGNLSGDGSGSTYTYNINNLLISAVQSSVTTTLGYDPSSRLLSIAKSGFGTTQFLYDGSDLIAEYDGSGTLLKRYVHGPGDDEPLVSYDCTNGGARTYLHADDNGSVVLLTNATGGLTQYNTYDEYGLPAAGNSGRFQYTGQTWLPELQMYYYKARIYHPILGRFMQADPIGYGDGMNWYAYVHGDPVNGSDSSGLCDDPVFGCPGQGTYLGANGTGAGGLSGGVAPGQSKAIGTEVVITGSRYWSSLHKAELAGENLKWLRYGADINLAWDVAQVIWTAVEPTPLGCDDFFAKCVAERKKANTQSKLELAFIAATKVHGNSYKSQKPTWLYMLINTIDGSIQKFGTTGAPDPNMRYTQFFITAWSLQLVPIQAYPDRQSARDAEVGLCQGYYDDTGHLPPLSKRC